MNSDDIISLFEAFVSKDEDKFYSVANKIIRDEERKKHVFVAEKLKNIVSEKSSNRKLIYKMPPIPRDNEKGFKLLDVKNFLLGWDDLIVSESVKNSVQTLISEIKNEELLETYGLTPNRKLLFYGPPGTGKTLTAKVLSSILGYPLVVVKFEAVISSYLGETSTNLRKIFDFIEEGQWVVLFDEFDVVGKKRDDPTEHGEIKRVVNNFMLMLEDYSGESIILASTNHPHILDNAVWRRFDDVVYFDMPDKTRRELLFRKNLRVIKKEEIDFSKLATMTKNFSGADIERACLNAVKKSILGDENILNYDTLRNSIDFEKKRIECQNKVIK